MCVCVFLLTVHSQGDGLAGLVLSVLVVDSLDVVASGVRGHRGQDDQRVVKGDGTEGTREGQPQAPCGRKHANTRPHTRTY